MLATKVALEPIVTCLFSNSSASFCELGKLVVHLMITI